MMCVSDLFLKLTTAFRTALSNELNWFVQIIVDIIMHKHKHTLIITSCLNNRKSYQQLILRRLPRGHNI